MEALRWHTAGVQGIQLVLPAMEDAGQLLAVKRCLGALCPHVLLGIGDHKLARACCHHLLRAVVDCAGCHLVTRSVNVHAVTTTASNAEQPQKNAA